MEEISSRWFGIVIAYVLPGFVLLAGLAPQVPVLAAWFDAAGNADTGLAGFLHLLVAATLAGLVVGCVRWCLLDSLLRWTGVRRPDWDESQLAGKLVAFDLLVEHHYRFYQFYGGVFVATPVAYLLHRRGASNAGIELDAVVLLLEIVMFTGARDALAKYYRRTLDLLGPRPKKELAMFTNGSHRPEDIDRKPTSAPQPIHNPANPVKPTAAPADAAPTEGAAPNPGK